MALTKIEWTARHLPNGDILPGYTFNPWIGCTHASEGCRFCYAETLMDQRMGRAQWGPNGTRVRTSAEYWKQPLKWNKEARAKDTHPLVFCASLADVFEDRPELDDWRIELFDLIGATPYLTWAILTKRPENINDVLFGPRHSWILGGDDYYPNLWLGTSVENQDAADRRIPHLLAAQGGVKRFLSVEPLLGPVALSRPGLLTNPAPSWIRDHRSQLKVDEDGTTYLPLSDDGGIPVERYIDWVIVGGESGPHARPMHPDWARAIRDQCQAAGVAFFFKQWGTHIPNGQIMANGIESLMYAAACEAFGGTAPKRSVQWDEQNWAYRVGKHAAGRLLDGREWNQSPES